MCNAFQVIQSGDPKANEIVLSNMIALLDRVFLDVTVRSNSRKYFVNYFHNGDILSRNLSWLFDSCCRVSLLLFHVINCHSQNMNDL